MSAVTIANQLANRNVMSAGEDGKGEGISEREALKIGSRMEIGKPSMKSIGESHAAEEEQDQVPKTKTVGGMSSLFKATQNGISQSSLQFGKTIHNSNFKGVARTTIASITDHLGAMPMPKKFQIAQKKAALEAKKAKAAEEKAEKEAIEAAGVKVPKKAKVNKFAYPTPEPLPPPKPLTVAEAMA